LEALEGSGLESRAGAYTAQVGAVEKQVKAINDIGKEKRTLTS
jgi:hypothetical protein